MVVGGGALAASEDTAAVADCGDRGSSVLAKESAPCPDFCESVLKNPGTLTTGDLGSTVDFPGVEPPAPAPKTLESAPSMFFGFGAGVTGSGRS